MIKMMGPRSSKQRLIVRAANIPGSNVGKKRHDLYAGAFNQIKEARARGFFIECIAICESIIADRLEARRACLNPIDISKHRFQTAKHLTEKLPKEETSDDREIRQLYRRISNWCNQRNAAVHEIVKLGNQAHTNEWKSRYPALSKTVDRGIRLARQLSRKVEILNKRDRKRQKAEQDAS
jgi:hypothetical protein